MHALDARAGPGIRFRRTGDVVDVVHSKQTKDRLRVSASDCCVAPTQAEHQRHSWHFRPSRHLADAAMGESRRSLDKHTSRFRTTKMPNEHDDPGLRLAPVSSDLESCSHVSIESNANSVDSLTDAGLCPDTVPRGLATLRVVVLTWSISVCLLAMVRPPATPPLRCFQ